MVRIGSQYEHVQALPVSTKEDPAGLFVGDSSDGRQFSTFDVEFDVEDDILLDWQQHSSYNRKCCPWLHSCLPQRLQQPPDWWWHLASSQRRLLYYGSWVAGGLLLLTVVILLAALAVSSSSNHAASLRYQPVYIQPQDSPYCSWDDLYLPNIIKPTNYKLHISTDMEEPYLVEGQVDILLAAAESTPCVVVHAHGVDMHSVQLLVYSVMNDQQEEGEPVFLQGVVHNSSGHHQQVTFLFPEAIPLPPLQPVLRLTFSYTLQEGLDGFYRSSFIDAANKTQVMGSTQFESIAARKAFPCFDEPGFKAPFEVKISAPPAPIIVLSNMPASHTHDSSSTVDDGTKQLVTYHFQQTPPMSTYLLAWVIGELAHVEHQCPMTLPAGTGLPKDIFQAGLSSKHHTGEQHDSGSGASSSGSARLVLVRVWGTSDRASQFGHARDVACSALQTFERLLQVAYPLPKLDLVAIPNFAAGAMENWGLLTYRETALLVDDSTDDISQRYGIATTVAHETAHQWFGDLVTLDDWTELWLNEGFATYFEVIGADAYRPDWGYFSDFLTSTTSPGLEIDGVATSHPLTIMRPTQKLSEIDNWFDDISYAKGGAVLRMLRAWLNRANGPMLGFADVDNSTTGNTVKDGSDGDGDGNGSDPTGDSSGRTSIGAMQHVRHRRSVLQQQHKRGQQWQQASSSSWRQQLLNNVQRERSQRARRLTRLLSADSSGSSNDASSSDSSSSVSGSAGAMWWTFKSHVGSTAPSLLRQAQQAPDSDNTGSGGSGSSQLRPSSTAAAAADTPGAAPEQGLGSTGDAAGYKDVFMAGLSSYLQARAYSVSNYSMLWQHIEHESGQPVISMMATWTLRRGFPIVSVSLDLKAISSNDSSSNQQLVQFEQVAFHAPRSFPSGLPYESDMYCNDWTAEVGDSSWWIPMAVHVGGSNSIEWHEFSNCSSTMKLPVPHNGWVLANAGRYGFYRVNYTEPLWRALGAAAAAHPTHITSIDYAGLLDDAYSLSLARQLNITVFFQLTFGLGSRLAAEHAPWSIGLGWLQRMTDLLANAALLNGAESGKRWQRCLADLKGYVSGQLTGPFIAGLKVPGQEKPGLGFEVTPNELPELRLLRPQVLTAAGFLGHTGVMRRAAQLLEQGAAGQVQISPDVTKAVYSLAVGSGDEHAYGTVRQLYEQAKDVADQERALHALARVSTASLISETLEYALSPAVRSQDFASLVVGLAKQGGLGFNITWEFVLTRTDDINSKYGGGDLTYTLGRKLNSLTRLFVDESLLARLKVFEKKQPGLLSPTFLDEANAARITNSDWLRSQGADACAWLSKAAAVPPPSAGAG